MSQLLKLCEKIVANAHTGDPMKDIIEPSGFHPDELLVELANHYVAMNKRYETHGVGTCSSK